MLEQDWPVNRYDGVHIKRPPHRQAAHKCPGATVVRSSPGPGTAKPCNIKPCLGANSKGARQSPRAPQRVEPRLPTMVS